MWNLLKDKNLYVGQLYCKTLILKYVHYQRKQAGKDHTFSVTEIGRLNIYLFKDVNIEIYLTGSLQLMGLSFIERLQTVTSTFTYNISV
jgi:hypothetical protein